MSSSFLIIGSGSRMANAIALQGFSSGWPLSFFESLSITLLVHFPAFTPMALPHAKLLNRPPHKSLTSSADRPLLLAGSLGCAPTFKRASRSFRSPVTPSFSVIAFRLLQTTSDQRPAVRPFVQNTREMVNFRILSLPEFGVHICLHLKFPI